MLVSSKAPASIGAPRGEAKTAFKLTEEVTELIKELAQSIDWPFTNAVVLNLF
jgi:deoxyribose-phosphate aldolase